MNIQPLSGNNVNGSGRTPGSRMTLVNAELSSMPPDVQFAPDTALKALLAELKNSLQVRGQLLGKMPVLIQEAVQDLLQNYLGVEKISQGLVVLTRAQKMLGDQLLSLASSLQDMATVEQSLTSQQKTAVASLLVPVAVVPSEEGNLGTYLFEYPDILIAPERLLKTSVLEMATLKDAITTIWENSPLGDSSMQPNTSADRKVFDDIIQKLLTQMPIETRTILSQDIPKLPEVWAMARLQAAFHWSSLSAEHLQQAMGSLQELATSLQKSALPDGNFGPIHQVLSFTLPLYFGDASRPYPAYIHIYNQEQEQTGSLNGEQRETWIRVCMDTENIGTVDVTFRLYQDNQVNLRVTFTALERANAFAAYVPEIRSAFTELPLKLREVTVDTAVK